MSDNSRTYSSPSYGGHSIITFGGPSGAAQTCATNGVYACHQFMFPAKVLSGCIKFGAISDGTTWRTGIEDCTEIGIWGGVELLRSTDSGTGKEITVIGTADFLGDTGTWLSQGDAGLSQIPFEDFNETSFDAGDFILFTCQMGVDPAINLKVDIEVVENFVNSDN